MTPIRFLRFARLAHLARAVRAFAASQLYAEAEAPMIWKNCFRTLLFSLLLCVPAFGQFVNVTHTGITDGSNTPLAHGLECFTPVSNNGTPIPASYPGGTAIKSTKCYTVTNGALAAGVTLLNSTVTSPLHLCYQMTLKNTDTSTMVISPQDGYGCIQLTGDVNLNTVPPSLPALALTTPGPRGFPGINGEVTNAALSTALSTSVISMASGGGDITVPPSLNGNLFVSIVGDGNNTHIYNLPPNAPNGTRVEGVNVGADVAFVHGSGNFPTNGYLYLQPAQGFTAVSYGGFWYTPGTLAYEPDPSLLSGDSQTIPNFKQRIYWSGNNGAVLSFPAAFDQEKSLTVVNYGSYPIQMAGSQQQPANLVISAHGSGVFANLGGNYWLPVAKYPADQITSIDGSFITGTIGSPQIPGLDASKITSGVFDPARIPGGSGGGGLSSAVANVYAAPQLFQMGPTVVQGYSAFGDSITNGAGASQNATKYVNVFGALTGSPINNYGFGGDEAPDLSIKVHANRNPLPANNPTASIFIGHNDINYNGATANSLNKYRASVQSSIAWLAVPNTSKVFGQKASLTGSFSANTSLPGFIGAMAVTGTANGDTVSFSMTTTSSNTPVYINWYGIDSDGGAASLSIDGSTVDSLTTQGPGGPINTVNGGHSAVWGKRYVIPSAGVHTFLLTITSATASGNTFTFLWAGMPAPKQPQPGAPRVYVLDPVYEQGFASKAVSDAYIAVLSPLVSQLQADGLYTIELPTNSFVDNASGMSGTPTTAPDGTSCPASSTPGLHPNDCGMKSIANMLAAYAMPTITPQSSSIQYVTTVTGAGATLFAGDELVFANGTGNIYLPSANALGESHYIYNYGGGTITVPNIKTGPVVLNSNSGAFFSNAGDGFLQILTSSPFVASPGTPTSSSASSAYIPGTLFSDDNYIYKVTASGTLKRVALGAF